jgi:hypothetical protein
MEVRTMEYHWYDLVGNIGVVCILITYLLLQTGILQSNMIKFSLLNLIGALLILVSLYFEFNLSAFLIEFFWLLISLVGLWKSLRTYVSKRGLPNSTST